MASRHHSLAPHPQPCPFSHGLWSYGCCRCRRPANPTLHEPRCRLVMSVVRERAAALDLQLASFHLFDRGVRSLHRLGAIRALGPPRPWTAAWVERSCSMMSVGGRFYSCTFISPFLVVHRVFYHMINLSLATQTRMWREADILSFRVCPPIMTYTFVQLGRLTPEFRRKDMIGAPGLDRAPQITTTRSQSYGARYLF